MSKPTTRVEKLKLELADAQEEVVRLRGYLKEVRFADFPGPTELYNELHQARREVR